MWSFIGSLPARVQYTASWYWNAPKTVQENYQFHYNAAVNNYKRGNFLLAGQLFLKAAQLEKNLKFNPLRALYVSLSALKSGVCEKSHLSLVTALRVLPAPQKNIEAKALDSKNQIENDQARQMVREIFDFYNQTAKTNLEKQLQGQRKKFQLVSIKESDETLAAKCLQADKEKNFLEVAYYASVAILRNPWDVNNYVLRHAALLRIGQPDISNGFDMVATMWLSADKVSALRLIENAERFLVENKKIENYFYLLQLYVGYVRWFDAVGKGKKDFVVNFREKALVVFNEINKFLEINKEEQLKYLSLKVKLLASGQDDLLSKDVQDQLLGIKKFPGMDIVQNGIQFCQKKEYLKAFFAFDDAAKLNPDLMASLSADMLLFAAITYIKVLALTQSITSANDRIVIKADIPRRLTSLALLLPQKTLLSSEELDIIFEYINDQMRRNIEFELRESAGDAKRVQHTKQGFKHKKDVAEKLETQAAHYKNPEKQEKLLLAAKLYAEALQYRPLDLECHLGIFNCLFRGNKLTLIMWRALDTFVWIAISTNQIPQAVKILETKLVQYNNSYRYYGMMYFYLHLFEKQQNHLNPKDLIPIAQAALKLQKDISGKEIEKEFNESLKFHLISHPFTKEILAEFTQFIAENNDEKSPAAVSTAKDAKDVSLAVLPTAQTGANLSAFTPSITTPVTTTEESSPIVTTVTIAEEPNQASLLDSKLSVEPTASSSAFKTPASKEKPYKQTKKFSGKLMSRLNQKKDKGSTVQPKTIIPPIIPAPAPTIVSKPIAKTPPLNSVLNENNSEEKLDPANTIRARLHTKRAVIEEEKQKRLAAKIEEYQNSMKIKKTEQERLLAQAKAKKMQDQLRQEDQKKQLAAIKLAKQQKKEAEVAEQKIREEQVQKEVAEEKNRMVTRNNKLKSEIITKAILLEARHVEKHKKLQCDLKQQAQFESQRRMDFSYLESLHATGDDKKLDKSEDTIKRILMSEEHLPIATFIFFCESTNNPVFLTGGFLRDLIKGCAAKDMEFMTGTTYAVLLSLVNEYNKNSTAHISISPIENLNQNEMNTGRFYSRLILENVSYVILHTPDLQNENFLADVLKRDNTQNGLRGIFVEERGRVYVEVTDTLKISFMHIQKNILQVIDEKRLSSDPIYLLRAVIFMARFKKEKITPEGFYRYQYYKNLIRNIMRQNPHYFWGHTLFVADRLTNFINDKMINIDKGERDSIIKVLYVTQLIDYLPSDIVFMLLEKTQLRRRMEKSVPQEDANDIQARLNQESSDVIEREEVSQVLTDLVDKVSVAQFSAITGGSTHDSKKENNTRPAASAAPHCS